jgi:hypothetical protein
MMLIAGLASCSSGPPEHGNLRISANLSTLSADGSNAFPHARYSLTLSVRNETIYQTAPESFDIGPFEASCEMYGSDAIAQQKELLYSEKVRNSGVKANKVVALPLGEFYHQSRAWPNWYIKCVLDRRILLKSRTSLTMFLASSLERIVTPLMDATPLEPQAPFHAVPKGIQTPFVT